MSDGLPYDYVDSALHERRERVYLILAGLFLGSMTMLNILGVSRFLDLSFQIGPWTIPLPLAVGVLPYPITFLCTDFISELYGRKRASHVVWVGLGLNLWVVLFLWLGGVLPPETSFEASGLPSIDAPDYAFYRIRQLTMGAVLASMVAYLAAQLVDVYLFHFWKRLTRGRHLWLRNNGSTLVSQLVDTVCVITITHYWAHGLPIDEAEAIWPQLRVFIVSGYVFKLVVALLDTIPFYLGVAWLSRYLQIDPNAEHRQWETRKNGGSSPGAS
ncbi:MAG: queuosine precursor transporter [Deltaproteobacteria bacterium]|nr:queuosine precursor transporter [Deltaproteobacteria bacterium]MBW2393890.1 queuosine precursor transporter [Deltaproteobacteria bacterium]